MIATLHARFFDIPSNNVYVTVPIWLFISFSNRRGAFFCRREGKAARDLSGFVESRRELRMFLSKSGRKRAVNAADASAREIIAHRFRCKCILHKSAFWLPRAGCKKKENNFFPLLSEDISWKLLTAHFGLALYISTVVTIKTLKSVLVGLFIFN